MKKLNELGAREATLAPGPESRLRFWPSRCKALNYRNCCMPPLGTIHQNSLGTSNRYFPALAARAVHSFAPVRALTDQIQMGTV